jgi:hypothetical protein
MAETNTPGVKRTGQRGLGWLLFVTFIGASLLLIGLTWRENLAGEEQGTPGYYRDTFVVDERVYATVTAEAAAAELALTPAPDQEE